MITMTHKEFSQLASFVKDNFGVHLKPEKIMLINNRLQETLNTLQLTSFSEYYDYVMKDKSGNALRILLDKVTTHHTFFYRESDHFAFVKNHVLPYYKNKLIQHDLRIWSAGCSSGEEPYTLAMLIDEFFGAEKAQWNTQILATDLSQVVLDVAVRGIYKVEATSKLPPGWLYQYFRRIDHEHVEVIERIKKEVIYRPFNLMEEYYPFKQKFHFIFCRNVMIYFDEPTKYSLIKQFYDHLEPGGFLMIGHAETLDRMKTDFQYVVPAIYRKPLA